MNTEMKAAPSPSPRLPMITSPLRARWRQQLQSRLPHTLRAVALTSLLLVSLLAVSLLASLLAFVALYRYSGYIPTVGWSSGELELKYGYGRAPFASVAGLGKAGIATGQVYDVWLSLELPDSETNLEVGNFMVDLDLQTPLGVSAVKASKSASLEWTPPLVRTVRTLLKLPLYLLLPRSLAPAPRQRLRIPLITRKTLRSFASPQITTALVSIGRKDAYPQSAEACAPAAASAGGRGRTQELQIYSATLHIVAHLTGIRRFMYYHRIASFIIFSSFFFLITVSSSLILWAALTFVSHRSRRQRQLPSSPVPASTPSTPATAEGGAEAHDAAEESAARERRREAMRHSGRRMEEEEEESVLRHIKLEDDDGVHALPAGAEEDSDSASGSSGSAVLVKADPDAKEEAAAAGAKVEHADETDTLLGGSATSASGSRRSFGTSTTRTTATGASTATSRGSAGAKMRKRASGSSLAQRAKAEDED